jgi:hypothetical protein
MWVLTLEFTAFEFLVQNYYEMKLEMHGFQCPFPNRYES